MMNMKKSVLKTMMVCGTAGLLLVGGTTAYLTDYDHAVNEFTVGKVEIDLTEPNWKPGDNTKITPEQVIKKDPQITNTGVNDAFVYLQVSVPKANVIIADEAGNRLPAATRELFSFTKSTNWTQIETKSTADAQIYTFTYNKVVKAKETTSTLFDTVKFANIVEGQLDTQQLNIPVRAYAIQTANTGGDEKEVTAQAKVAYQKYVNQNLKLDGQVMG